MHATTKDGDAALHLALKGCNPGAAELLLERGADVTAEDKGGKTALHIAAERGRSDLVGVLLKQGGVAVNAVDENGLTPLHWSAARGRLKPYEIGDGDHRGVVELLATHGGDVTAEDDEGWMPVHRAALPGATRTGRTVEPDVRIINYLLREAGAIVPLAKSVVEAQYGPRRGTKRPAPSSQARRGWRPQRALSKGVGECLTGNVYSRCV